MSRMPVISEANDALWAAVPVAASVEAPPIPVPKTWPFVDRVLGPPTGLLLVLFELPGVGVAVGD